MGDGTALPAPGPRWRVRPELPRSGPGDELINAVTGAAAAHPVRPTHNLVVLAIAANIRHRGRGARILVPPDGAKSPIADADRDLIVAIAHARRWHHRLLTDVSVSMTALAREAKLDRSHVRRRLRLAFLAPDIVSMIVSGRQDGALTIDQLTKAPLPLDWRQHRRRFILAQG